MDMVGIPNAASRRRCFFVARAPRKENGSEKIAAPLWWSRRRRFFRKGNGFDAMRIFRRRIKCL
ncbi:hypothetical protein B4135_1444 [Caldibacillus debilis]|uniref:Uncharacterized protein n=1 Tax=Caldibacillus debilis TaxID=301148 RepID=A0A150MCW7_9BACI|nr:hypothetical protein B4135_1444 [Caldibacillus debilis]